MFNRQGNLENNVKRTGSFLKLSLAIASLLAAGTLARADSVTITLSAPFQTILSTGGVLDFSGTITNTTAGIEYLNGDNTYVDSPLGFDDSPFINNAPLTLGAGDSYTGILFSIDVAPGTPTGLYAGYFQILGGPDNSSELFPLEVPADFDVRVTPEPASWVLLATALLGLVAVAGRNSLRRQTAV
jgi:hypothetical protein